jgi:hypothetical protein
MSDSMLHTPHDVRREESPLASLDVGALCARGAVAGLVAGFTFVMANMWYAGAHGKPSVAPFLDISTIFHASKAPVLDPNEVVVGLVTHFALAMLFGIVFAFAVHILRLAHQPPLLVVAALVYGLALYVVNFQVIGRAAFPWFVNSNGPNQTFELWIHPIGYGLFLVPFFLGSRSTSRHP